MHHVAPWHRYDVRMVELFRASFRVINWVFPSRNFVKKISLRTAVGAYIVTTIFSSVVSYVEFGPPLPGSSLQTQMIFDVGLDLVGILVTLAVSTWVINKYAAHTFSYLDMFSLQMVLTSGASIVGAVLAYVLYLLAGPDSGLANIGMGVFGIYMLLVMQSAVSSIASITKNQAAYVILAPLFAFFAVWLAIIGPIFVGVLATQ